MSDTSLGKAVLELFADGTGLNSDLKTAEDKVRASADLMQNLLGAIGIGFSLKAVLDATIEAEHEEQLLANAGRATGMAAGFTTNQLRAQQVALQSTTAIGDEAISSMQRALMTFRNVHGEVFKSTIKLALDFAAATGGNATEAVRMFGMALNDPVNNMARLKRAGVDLSDALKTQIEDLIANGNLVGAQKLLIDQLSKSYNGAAIAARGTLGGALVALKENFANLFLEQEGAGKQLRIFIELVNKSLPTVASVFSAVFAAVRTQIEGVVSNLFYLGQGLNRLIHGELTAAMGSFGEIVNPITLMATSVASGTLAFQEASAGIRDTVAASNELAVSAPVNAGIVAEAALQQQAAFAAASKANESALKRWDDALAASIAIEKKMAAERVRMAAERVATIASSLTSIATLQYSHNKTMAAIGKAAAMSQATIDTYIGVGKAWALGPIIGPPLAALVLTAGLANVARIAGVPGLEKGGPMSSGQTALVGEAGPELFTAPRAGHIIPNGEFGGAGGVQVTNNINVSGLDFSSETIAERILTGIADAARRGTEAAIPAANAFNSLALAYSGRA